MSDLKKKSIFALRKESVPEIERYFLKLRKYEYSHGVELKGIKERKRIHKLLFYLLKIDRKIKGEKLIVLKDKRVSHNKPVIYAATHIGGNDVERVFESIGEHAYVMIGDPGIMYVNTIGKSLDMNGWLPLNTRDKEDRRIAYRRSVELLKKGGNLLVFPEGAYNVFENLPVMNIFPGVVKMARETGCEIIPVAIEQYANNFFVNIGKNMSVSDDALVKETNQMLRDELATLKWEIWEQQAVAKRSSYSIEYAENFRKSIMDRSVYGDYEYTLQDIYETMYHDKDVTEPKEAFTFLERLKPNRKNAFLYRR